LKIIPDIVFCMLVIMAIATTPLLRLPLCVTYPKKAVTT
jgi:hypothetical protein